MRRIAIFSAVYAPLRSVLNVCHWHTAPPLHTSPPNYYQNYPKRENFKLSNREAFFG